MLVDDDSREWRWLSQSILDLKRLVDASGSHFVLAVFPLSYQMRDDYPYHPQENFKALCAAHRIHCVDLLDEFEGHDASDLFLMKVNERNDVWHLSEAGHALTADILFRELQTRIH